MSLKLSPVVILMPKQNYLEEEFGEMLRNLKIFIKKLKRD
jgi:hypothetical protein